MYVILQSLFSGDADITMFRLTGGSISNNSVTITITLKDEVVDNILLSPFLCTRCGNCYLSLTADAFTDVAENTLVPLLDGRLGQLFMPDNLLPQLTDFEVNLEAFMLAPTFSEVVSTVDLMQKESLYNQTLIQLKDIHCSEVVLVQMYE